jgi:hypothetical protein
MFGVIEPCFFEEHNRAFAADSEHYCTVLQTFLAKEL